MPGCPVSPTAVATMAMGFANRVSDGHIAPAEGDQKNRKVLVVFTHPRGSKSYAHSMLESTVNGLTAAGHSTRVRRLYYESAHHQESYNGRDFPAVLTDAERTDYLADETLVARTTPEGLVKIGAASEVQQAVADLKWCDSVVFVHPTWWFGFPAILKGYMDRVLVSSDLLPRTSVSPSPETRRPETNTCMHAPSAARGGIHSPRRIQGAARRRRPGPAAGEREQDRGGH